MPHMWGRVSTQTLQLANITLQTLLQEYERSRAQR